MKKILTYILILASGPLSAQFDFDYNDSIPVKVGIKDLGLAWGGGLNYVQVSDIDFDFDGDMDLFLFDRSRDNVRLLEQVEENGNKKYKVRHNVRSFFPEDLRNRTALFDYDADGKKDILTYGIGGVKVYKNTGSLATGLSWQLITAVIESDYDGDYSNLYVSSADIPAYVDIDFDGDMDVMTFSVSGDHLEYHQNQSQELYGHSDSLVFILKNRCWGKFEEDAISSEIVLNVEESPCGTGNVPNPQLNVNTDILKADSSSTFIEPDRHAGSTVLALDFDHSGVYDLVLGDVNLNNLTLMTNGGTDVNSNSPIVSMDANFPSNTTPVNISLFPAAFFVDVDFDEIKDLLVCPNAKTISQNEKSIYFYKNLGTNELPVFSFRSKSYFQEEMIEVGTGAIPVLIDQNGDGIEDLLVANFFRYKEPLAKESVIYNYRNTGTATAPFLSFVESDYLDFTSESYGLRTVPTFGDLDADGDQDLILGLESGTLVYKENTAGAGNAFTFANPVNDYQDNLGNVISAEYYAFPQLFDLNDDGLLDLIVGKKTGELMYYQNIGTATSPSFELKNDTLGGIDLATLTPEGYAAPHFFNYQDTIRLLLGGFDGKLRFYDQVEDNLLSGQSFHLISDAFKDIDVEAYSSCFVNDLDNDGNLDLFVGGDLGGLFHLEHNENSILAAGSMGKAGPAFELFPNPAKEEITIKLNQQLSNAKLTITSTLGEVVSVCELKASQTIDVSSLSPGTYILVLESKNPELISRQKLIINR